MREDGGDRGCNRDPWIYRIVDAMFCAVHRPMRKLYKCKSLVRLTTLGPWDRDPIHWPNLRKELVDENLCGLLRETPHENAPVEDGPTGQTLLRRASCRKVCGALT